MRHIAYRKVANGPLWLWRYDYDQWMQDERQRIERRLAASASDADLVDREMKKAIVNEAKGAQGDTVANAYEVYLVPGGYSGDQWVYGEPTHAFDGKAFASLAVAA
jgi:phage protein D